MNDEKRRLTEDAEGQRHWKKWGPYLSDRQWGTVREDYSAGGDAWDYFPHDHARSRAYRWGEDGIAGFSDHRQRLCLGVALWNGVDPILKERFYGLNNSEGNHGEDPKELYYYLDATPTHSYLKMLYKYPQQAYPYQRLIDENRARNRRQPEYELMDTGIFDDDRYFDVFVEYAQTDDQTVLMQVTVFNRGPEAAPIWVLPSIWYRNLWSWQRGSIEPSMTWQTDDSVEITHHELGTYYAYADGSPEWLFCNNETNADRHPQPPGTHRYAKDAFHDYLVGGDKGAVHPERFGTKCAASYALNIPAGGSATVRLKLASEGMQGLLKRFKAAPKDDAFAGFDAILEARRSEADEFWGDLQQDLTDDDEKLVQRQAWAGMIWSKQYYRYNVMNWLKGDSFLTPPAERKSGRNADWKHLNNADIVSMPDKWEYPWYAAWDLAFHCVPIARFDPHFAKDQLVLLTREWYMHPNGQLPAYEWNFADVNPPVHAWATWRVYQIDRRHHRDGQGDIVFLERVFHKLLLNFTWWVNRKDANGLNIFQGGFLGLDNIGVFDRSKPLPTGGYINQADGTSWMAMYSLNLMRIALELALHNPVYQDIATKFLEHFLNIAYAMTNMGGEESGIGLWNEQDEFYYDELILPNGTLIPLKVRSLVGLIPMFAVETLEPELLDRVPEFTSRLEWFLTQRPDLANLVSRWQEKGRGERRLLSLLRGSRLKRLLKRLLDETEFLSDYGVRSLSRVHKRDPYVFECEGQNFEVHYVPGDSDSGMFGGNSNWRGPIWFPLNHLIIESLQKFHFYYGDDYVVECPTGSGTKLTLKEVAEELTRRLKNLFLRDEHGRRAMFGGNFKMQTDPHFRDYLLFHEFFHGDNGSGLGANHQTGWTGLIATLIAPRREATVCAIADRLVAATEHDH